MTEIDFYKRLYPMVARPGMFGIYRIEDLYFLLWGGHLFSDEEMSGNIGNFLNEFRTFVNKEFRKDGFTYSGEYEWPKLIRIPTSNDVHALEYLKRMVDNFLISKGVDIQLLQTNEVK